MINFYYIFLIFTIFFSTIVIVSRNPIYSVLCLILVFLNTTFILFLFNIEFLPLILLIIYAGAVSVLFLFVILLLNITIEVKPATISFIPLLIGFKFSYNLLFNYVGAMKLFENELSLFFTENVHLKSKIFWLHNELTAIGSLLYTQHFLLLFLCTIILLVAMLGALILTKR